MEQFRYLYQKIVRDRLSFWLLVINYIFILFVLYNASSLLQKLKIEQHMLKPYEHQMTADLVMSQTELYGIDAVDDFFKCVEHYKIYHIKFNLYLPVGNGVTMQDVTIYFDNNELMNESIDKRFSQGEQGKNLYIGENIVQYAYKDNDHTYIEIMGTSYSVTGIYRNEFAGGEDGRISIAWDLLTDHDKKEVCSYIYERLRMGMYLQLTIASDSPLTDTYEQLCNELSLCGIECELTEQDKNVSYQSYWYKTLNKIGTFGMCIFALIDCYAVTTVWMMRRKKEILIRKSLGVRNWEVMLMLITDIIKHMICATPFFAVIELGYVKLGGDILQFNRYTVYKYGALLLGMFVVIILSLLISILCMKKYTPADGLKGD